MQKSLAKMRAKTILNEADILQVTREIQFALLEADVNFLVVKNFVKAVKEKAIGSEIVGKLNPSQQMIKIVSDELISILGSESVSLKVNHNLQILMMVGLQGSGKTTTSAKVAKYFLSKNFAKKPLLVAADIYRPAAVEQLMALGKQLNIPVFFKEKATPQEIAEKALIFAKEHDHDFMIIDTAGRLAINDDLMQELVDIKKLVNPHEILFVIDALSGQDIINVAKIFNEKLKLSGTIITKLDSDARGGAAVSIRSLLNIPIVFIGTGEKINNLDLFYPDRMAKRILGMGDVLSLVEKAQEVMDEDQSQKMMQRMATGRFNLNDLLEQLRQIKKMGRMSKILQMIPGMANKISPEKIASAEKKLRLFEILISSMTKVEKRNPRLLKNNDRKRRIIKGSGRNAQEYNLLVNEFDRVSKQMKQMSKSISDGTFNPQKLGFK